MFQSCGFCNWLFVGLQSVETAGVWWKMDLVVPWGLHFNILDITVFMLYKYWDCFKTKFKTAEIWMLWPWWETWITLLVGWMKNRWLATKQNSSIAAITHRCFAQGSTEIWLPCFKSIPCMGCVLRELVSGARQGTWLASFCFGCTSEGAVYRFWCVKRQRRRQFKGLADVVNTNMMGGIGWTSPATLQDEYL